MLGSFYDSDMDKETIVMKSSVVGSIKVTEKDTNDIESRREKVQTPQAKLFEESESDEEEDTLVELKYDLLKDDA